MQSKMTIGNNIDILRDKIVLEYQTESLFQDMILPYHMDPREVLRFVAKKIFYQNQMEKMLLLDSSPL